MIDEKCMLIAIIQPRKYLIGLFWEIYGIIFRNTSMAGRILSKLQIITNPSNTSMIVRLNNMFDEYFLRKLYKSKVSISVSTKIIK